MSDQSRHRRRSGRADDLSEVARARLAHARVTRSAGGSRGWVPAPPGGRDAAPAGEPASDIALGEARAVTHDGAAAGLRAPADGTGAAAHGAGTAAAAKPAALAATAAPATRAVAERPAVGERLAVGERPSAGERFNVGDRLPLALRGASLSPGARVLGGLVLVAALGLVLGLVFTWLSRPQVEAAPQLRRIRPATAAAGAADATVATPSPSASVVVHVVGAVRRPGVVELPAGSRVSDAVEAAGGPTRRASLASVNLARLLVDGEQLLVLTRGQAPPATAPAPALAGPPGAVAGGGVLDLNTATLEQLEELPGVGPVLAQRIIDWRTENGRFSTVDELTEVSGIGESRLADIKPLVRV